MDGKLKIILLLAVVMAALLGVFVFITGGTGEADQPDSIYGPGNIMPELADDVILTDRDPADMVRLTLYNPDGPFTFLQKEGSSPEDWNFYLEEAPDLVINQSRVNSLPTNVARFIVLRQLTDNPEDLAQYGLDNPAKAVAEYKDGTTETILMGGQSADKNYYYCTVEGDKAVYLVATFTGDRYYYNYEDFVDKTLPSLDFNDVTYLEIKEWNKAPFQVAMGYADGVENVASFAEGLVMQSIYPGRVIYTENLYTDVFSALRGLSITGLGELYYEELGPYGLDTPSLRITVTAGGETHFYALGDEVGDEIYFIYDDDPHVYKISQENTGALYNLSAFDYMEKFIHLTDINFVTDIYITTPEKEYVINLNHYEGDTENSYPIAPAINGIEVDQMAFRTAYQSFIGVTYDSAIDENALYADLPSYQTTIMLAVPEDRVNLDAPALDNGIYDKDAGAYRYEININYYAYNDNFYAVERDGNNPAYFAVSNRRLAAMLDPFEALALTE